MGHGGEPGADVAPRMRQISVAELMLMKERRDALRTQNDMLLAALKKIHARADGGSTWTDIAYIAAKAIEAAESHPVPRTPKREEP